MAGLNAFWKVRKKVVYHVTASFLALVFSSSAYAAPSGGVVTAGQATINQSGNTTTINQSTQNAAINWQKFGINSSETVNFVQPNVSSITLNRVVGNEQSVINGALNANGQVFILNSNGILFGQGARINTAGLVATTMSLSDADFMAGNYSFTDASDASVVNLGEITITDGGYAALLAKNVENGGSITAIKGRIHMVGADSVSINLNGNSMLSLTVDKGVVDALVKNNGAIIANGGEIYLTANAADQLLKSVVNNEGILEAQTLDDIQGKIIVFAHGGDAEIGGTLTTGAGQGFIETSGKNFSVDAGTNITTGEWLIDPVNVTVDSILAAAIKMALESNADVTVKTDGTGYDTTGHTAEGVGDINITGQIQSFGGTGSLTFDADHDINVSTTVTVEGGDLTFNADNNITISGPIVGTSTTVYGKGNLNMNAGGDISLSGMVFTQFPSGNSDTTNIKAGDINITAGGDINTQGGTISSSAMWPIFDMMGPGTDVVAGNINMTAGGDINMASSTELYMSNYDMPRTDTNAVTGINLFALGNIDVQSNNVTVTNSNFTATAGGDFTINAFNMGGTSFGSDAHITAENVYLNGGTYFNVIGGRGFVVDAIDTLFIGGPVDLGSSDHIALNYDSMSFSPTPTEFLGSLNFSGSSIKMNGLDYQVISSANAFRDMINGNLAGNYVLTTDLSNISSGNYFVGSSNTPFTGNFNGFGHSISYNVSENAGSSNFGLGLFRTAAGEADISNVLLSGTLTNTNTAPTGALVGNIRNDDDDSSTRVSVHDIVVNGMTLTAKGNGGGVVGYAEDADLSRIVVGVSTINSTGYNNLGGVVGEINNGSVVGSSSLGNTMSSTYGGNIGGVVGNAENTLIMGSGAMATTISGAEVAGGVVGSASNSILDSTISFGVTINNSDAIGGIVGSLENSVVKSAQVMVATLSGTYDVGGVVGYAYDSYIDTSMVTGSTLSATQNSIGGIVGYISNTDVTDTFVGSTTITGSKDVGGIFGTMDDDAPSTVKGSIYDSATVEINGSTDVKGYGQATEAIFNAYIADGTVTVPLAVDADGYYLVSSVADFKVMATYAQFDVNFKLTADIDLTGETAYIPVLRGTLDGAHHTISNLTVTDAINGYKGLIGILSGGTVENLTVNNVKVSGLHETGSVVGWVYGEHDVKTGVLTGASTVDNVIVGGNSGYVYNGGRVELNNIGGVIGMVSDGSTVSNTVYMTVTDPAVDINITGASGYTSIENVGGVIGNVDINRPASIVISDVISDSKVDISIDTTGEADMRNVGGLIGAVYNGYDTNIDLNVFADVDVNIDSTANESSLRNIGGVFGYVSGSNITSTVAMGDVTIDITGDGSVESVGGLAGYIDLSNLTNADVTSSITITGDAIGIESVGGLAGAASESTFDGTSMPTVSFNISGSNATLDNFGGYIGYSYGDTIDGINVDSNMITGLNISGDSAYGIGGFIGYSSYDTISNVSTSYDLDLTTFSSVDSVGALIGSTEGGFDYKNAYYDEASFAGDQSNNLQSYIDNYLAVHYTDELKGAGYLTDYEVYYDSDDDITYLSIDIYNPLVKTGSLTNASSAADITVGDATNVGGLVGYTYAVDMKNVSATGNVTVNGSAEYVGGITGYISQSSDDTSYGYQYGSSANLQEMNDAFDAIRAANPDLVAGGWKLVTYPYDNGNGYSWEVRWVKEDFIGSIDGATYNGTIEINGDASYVGGIVGYFEDIDVKNLTSTGAINIDTPYVENVGGVIGQSYGGSVTDSHSHMDINITAVNVSGVGGFVGTSEETAYKGTNYAEGDVYADGFNNISNIGGFAGGLIIAGESYSDNSSASTEAEAQEAIDQYLSQYQDEIDAGWKVTQTITEDNGSYLWGAMVSNRPAIDGAYATGDVTAVTSASAGSGNSSVGGFAGTISAEVNNVYATGNVTAEKLINVGGLAGSSMMSNITGSHAEGNVTGYANSGGLVGVSIANDISRSYSTGNVTGDENATITGGLVGMMMAGSVKESYASGDVTGGEMVGGIIGSASLGTVVKNVYVSGNVTGTDKVGGIAGMAENGITLENSYVSGTVSGTGEDVKGLIGFENTPSTVTASYFDKTVNPNLTDAEGFGKTTEELQSLATYEGWDIEEVDGDLGYPTLTMSEDGSKWQVPAGISLAELIQQALDSLETDVTGVSTNINALITSLGSHENLSESQISILVQAYNDALAALNEASDASESVNSIYGSISDATDKDALEDYVTQANEALDAFNTSYQAAQSIIDSLTTFTTTVNAAVDAINTSITNAQTASGSAASALTQAQTAAGDIPDSTVTEPLAEAGDYASAAEEAAQAAALLESAIATGSLDEINAAKASAEEYYAAAQEAAEAAQTALSMTSQAVTAYNTALATAQTSANESSSGAQSAFQTAADILAQAQSLGGSIPDPSVTTVLADLAGYVTAAQEAADAAATAAEGVGGTLAQIDSAKTSATDYSTAAAAAAAAAQQVLATAQQAITAYNTALATAQTVAQEAAAGAQSASQSSAAALAELQQLGGTIPDSSVTSALAALANYVATVQTKAGETTSAAAGVGGTLAEIEVAKTSTEQSGSDTQTAFAAVQQAYAAAQQAISAYSTALTTAQTAAQEAAAGAQSASQAAAAALAQIRNLAGSIPESSVTSAIAAVADYVTAAQQAAASAATAASGVGGTLDQIDAAKTSTDGFNTAAATAATAAQNAIAAAQQAITAYNSALTAALTASQASASGAAASYQSAAFILSQAQSLGGNINDQNIAAILAEVAKYAQAAGTASQSAQTAVSGVSATKTIAEIEAARNSAVEAMVNAQSAQESAQNSLSMLLLAVTAYNNSHVAQTTQQTAVQSVVSSIVNTTVVTPPVITPPTPFTQIVPPSPIPFSFPQMSFGGVPAENLTVTSEPGLGGTIGVVTTSELQYASGGTGEVASVASGGEQTSGAAPSGNPEVRVSLGSNSIVELVNGGMNMPEGVEQQFYVGRRGDNQ